MSQHEVLSSPAGIVQLIDWRFTQIQQGLFLHSNGIKNTIDAKFRSLDEKITHFLEELHVLKESITNNKEDIQELQEDEQMILDRLETLERKLESTEQTTRACNVKFMNVEELEWEDDHISTQYITDVLNAHVPSPNWRQEDISRAYRVGKPRPWRSEPRPIIVHFCRWSDKMAVLGDRSLRDNLRESGIKVSSDLTTQQRETVEFHRGQGKIAYIHHGKLHVRDRHQRPLFSEDIEHHNYNRSAHPQEEDWPPVPDSRRERYSRAAEPRRFDRHQPVKDYRQQHRKQQNEHRLHLSENLTNDSSQSRLGGRSFLRKHEPSFPQRNRYAAKSEDSPKSQRTTSYHSNPMNGATPVVPGLRSYSEVVRQEGQSESARKIIYVKDNPKRTPAVPYSQNRRGISGHQQKRVQTVASDLQHDLTDLDRQDRSDENRQPDGTDNHFISSEDVTGQRTVVDKFQDSGDNISDKAEDDKTDREDNHHHDVTDDDMEDLSEVTKGTTIGNVQIIDEDTEVGSRDDKTGNTENSEHNETESSVDRLETKNTSTEEQTEIQDTDNMPEQTAEHVRQSASTGQVLRPRRAASQTDPSRQSSRKVPARCDSQSSITDSFKKLNSGDSMKEQNLTPLSKTKTRSGVASGAKK